MEKLLEDFEALLHVTEKEEVSLFPLGTYPGSFTPDMRQERGYKIKEQIFGKNRFNIAGRCIGFHCHYTLPWGVFDKINLIPKILINSKNKQSMVNSYNLLIAMDPALTTFTQSSPFYQGVSLGKDSRVIVYRGGDVLDYPQGLYANFQDFGGLQPYRHTGTDLLHLISSKYDKWKKTLKKIDVNLKVFRKHGSTLDTTWNPVKLNANGTLEQRGMDMNHPMIITAAAVVIKYILKHVQEDFMQVMPSDMGLNEPFRIEENVIFIPPHTYVRRTMQPKAAHKGLDDQNVFHYCKGLLKLAKSCIPKEKHELIAPFSKMLDERKTVSDEILQDVKKMGYNLKSNLPGRVAAEIAIEHSKRLFKEVMMTKKMVQDMDA
jgi:hypothetical protein